LFIFYHCDLASTNVHMIKSFIVNTFVYFVRSYHVIELHRG